jgi:pilus assembly protein CpaF
MNKRVINTTQRNRSSSTQEQVLITVLSTGGPLQTLTLKKTENLLGSGDHCDLKISDPTISQNHALIVQNDIGLSIKDLKSTNGTRIKRALGSKKVKDELIPWQCSEKAVLGNIKLEWRLGQAEPPKETSEDITQDNNQEKIESSPPKKESKKDLELKNAFLRCALEFIQKEFYLHEEDELLSKESLLDSALSVSYQELKIKDPQFEWPPEWVHELREEAFGDGPLKALLEDPNISDILVNGSKDIYVEKAGRLERTSHRFISEQSLFQLIRRLTKRAQQRIDFQRPYADGRLPDGSRLHAMIPPLSLKGPLLAIRRFQKTFSNVSEAIQRGFFPEDLLPYLKESIHLRKNILISGGTGSGKTTFLNLLANLMDPRERVITIEDAAELQLDLPHVIPLETRTSSTEGNGEITMSQLLKNSLRMRPDRIVIGECRGTEVVQMLQAMNTGHSGSLTTVHANNAREALSRLELMLHLSGIQAKENTFRRWIAQSIHLVIHLTRLEGGSRRVAQVFEVRGLEGEVFSLKEVYAL